MSNMAYCRFKNTAHDLRDCILNWHLDEDAPKDEIKAKENIIAMARDIVEKEGQE